MKLCAIIALILTQRLLSAAPDIAENLKSDALAGDTKAVMSLTEAYFHGNIKGIPQDYREAYIWGTVYMQLMPDFGRGIERVMIFAEQELYAQGLTDAQHTALNTEAKSIVNRIKQQPSAASTTDVQQCEAATRRILATPHSDENLIGALYGPRLRFLLLRGLNAEPGTDHWINWDYVYETQDDMPSVLSDGPGRADGDRIAVPVLMLRPWETPARKTKTWIFKRFNGQWLVDEVIDLDGQSLTRVLDNP